MVTEKMIEAAAPSTREAIARVIDPHNFMISGSAYGVDDEGFKTTWAYMAQQVALTKADQIIAALSTDAEPVLWANPEYMPKGDYLDACCPCQPREGGDFTLPLYAAPPAPSVAVKALEWVALSPESPTSHYRAETPIFPYEIDCGPVVSGGRWTGSWTIPARFHTLEEAKAAAQADYESRIRSALSAQVQDVAGWQPIETAPKDKTRIIIAVPTKDRDDWIVGEGYFDPDHYEDGDWWWANLDYSDYHAGPISDCNHWTPELWQPLPVPAAAPAAKQGEAE